MVDLKDNTHAKARSIEELRAEILSLEKELQKENLDKEEVKEINAKISALLEMIQKELKLSEGRERF
jgi:uncharacterized coiled-coil DUF342 family protein